MNEQQQQPFVKYDSNNNPMGAYMPGVPLADMTQQQYESFPDSIRGWIDEQPFYIKQGDAPQEAPTA